MYITFIHMTLWVIKTVNWHLGKKSTILRSPKELTNNKTIKLGLRGWVIPRCSKMTGSPGQTRSLMWNNMTSSWAKICKLIFFPILVGIWWYWVSRGQYLLVLGGTESVLGSTGWYLVILGQYKAVLTGTWLYLLTFQMFRYHVFGAHSKNGYLVFRGLNQNCWWRMVCPRN